jgi:hemerythrin superfamily protein
MRILADHAEIRGAVRDIEERLAAKTPMDAEEIGRLGKLLHDHVRLEENEVFPRIEKALGEKQLNAMGRGLTRLHSKHDVCDI